MKKEIGIIGLGKMGAGLGEHLLEQEWSVYGMDPTLEARERFVQKGGITIENLSSLREKLEAPRSVWLMVPAGDAVEEVLFGDHGLAQMLERGDIIIDGGNSFYKDSAARARRLAEQGIRFSDVGVSGGPHGARYGACLMVGGTREVFDECADLWSALAVTGGVAFFEGAGAGHFVKMIHNGIEYGMMQAIAEGFTILKNAPLPIAIDVEEAARVYNNGSVITSRLIEWLSAAYATSGIELADISSAVGASGEGEWTVKTAKELGILSPVIDDAVAFRHASQKNPTYTGQVLSALRNQFGGHAIQKSD